MKNFAFKEPPIGLRNCVRLLRGRGRARQFVYDISTEKMCLRVQLADGRVILRVKGNDSEYETSDRDKRSLVFLASHTTFRTLLWMRSAGFAAQAEALALIKRSRGLGAGFLYFMG